MSRDLNLYQCIGRLGKDPELKKLGDSSVVNFSLAVGWKTAEKEGVEWVPVVAFGKLADVIAKYLGKGSRIYVSGRFTTRKWQDKEGKDRYTTEIVAGEMQMLDSKADGVAPAADRPYQQNAPADPKKTAQQTASFDDETIPF